MSGFIISIFDFPSRGIFVPSYLHVVYCNYNFYDFLSFTCERALRLIYLNHELGTVSTKTTLLFPVSLAVRTRAHDES